MKSLINKYIEGLKNPEAKNYKSDVYTSLSLLITGILFWILIARGSRLMINSMIYTLFSYVFLAVSIVVFLLNLRYVKLKKIGIVWLTVGTVISFAPIVFAIFLLLIRG